MSLLAFLPQSIIDSIMDEKMSASVIKLWICGDRLMRHKISTGITTINLLDRWGRTPSRFPKFIEELHVLRELTIDRAGYTMPYYRNIHQRLQSLPSTLKKLIIRVNQAGGALPLSPSNDCCTPHSVLHTTINELGDVLWSFAGAFPQLETLELDSLEFWTPRDCDLLPPSITSLSLSLSDYVDDATIIQWPPLLVSLKIFSGVPNFLSFWTHLPPHLTFLHAYSRSLLPTVLSSALPRSLTKLKGGFDAQLSLIDLPPGLESLDTEWMRDFDPDTPIGLIFPKLTRFKTGELTNQLACSLPPTVRSIEADMDDIIPRHHWPPSLTDLTVNCDRLHLFKVAASLPRSLLRLEAYFDEFVGANRADFPPQLTSLQLSFQLWYSDAEIPFRDLPSSITDLHLGFKIPASQLKHLPPRLKTLHMLNLTIGDDFNPTDDTEMKAMMLRFEIGRRERILESFDFTQLKRASVLALLPRTLTRWRFMGVDPIDDWSHMPPLIESFSSGGAFNLDFLRQLPHMTNLRYLSVNLKGVEEEDLHLVTKGLRSSWKIHSSQPHCWSLHFPAY